MKLASDALGARPHTDEAKAGRSLSIEPMAIVLHREMHPVPVALKLDRDTRGSGMPRDICQCLLHNPKQVRLGLVSQTLVKACLLYTSRCV